MPRSFAWILLCATAALVLGFLLAPILVVLVEAFNDATVMSFPPRRLSLRWFRAFAANDEFLGSMAFSLQLALLAAAAATVCGTLAAIALARRASLAAETLLLAPLYVPRVMVGLALLLSYAWLELSGSFAGLLLAHVLITLPYTTRSVLAALRAIDPSVHEAARMLGASGPAVFRRVTLPLARDAVLSGFVFALIVSFSDIYLALFISGPDSITMPLRLFTFMEWDQSPLVAAASAVQIALILAVIAAGSRLFGLAVDRTE